MSASVRYGAAAAALVTLATFALWPFLQPPARAGVVIAAVVALTVQVVSFSLLQLFRGELKRFLAVWVGGTLLRMAAIAGVAVLVLQSGTEGAAPALLALAAFFFGLLLLEPIYFRAGAPVTVRPSP